jgi:uncharacterized protein (TIGR02118 family)
MARFLVMYKMPADPAAFDKHYFEVHVPLAKKIPGLTKFETSKGPVGTPAGPSSYYLVVTLHFDSMAAIGAGMGSPEGQAAVADLKNFVTESPDILMFENQEV